MLVDQMNEFLPIILYGSDANVGDESASPQRVTHETKTVDMMDLPGFGAE